MIEQMNVVTEAVNSGMMQKIQLTSLIVVVLFWIPIQTIDAEKMNYSTAVVVFVGLVVSLTTLVVTTLINIWL